MINKPTNRTSTTCSWGICWPNAGP